MAQQKIQAVLNQLIQTVVPIAHGVLNKCQDFAMKTFPQYLDYYETLKTWIVSLLTIYLLPLFENGYNVVSNAYKKLTGSASERKAFILSILSIPFAVVLFFYMWSMTFLNKLFKKIMVLKEHVTSRYTKFSNKGKEIYERIKSGKFSFLIVWQNTLNIIIDYLNNWLKNAEEGNHLAKYVKEWNVIGYLTLAKFERQPSQGAHPAFDEN